MPSAAEPGGPVQAPPQRRFRAEVEAWNRRLHIYLGLFLLFFVWLFAFTGLLLNHPNWSLFESWKNRVENQYEQPITPIGPGAGDDLGQAQEIMRQLEVVGEILWTTTRADPSVFEFQVRRPGHFIFIKADLARNRVTVRKSDVNLWGVAKVLHTFTGVQLGDVRNSRDWILTSLWVFSMDATAVGLILMVLGGVYLWYRLPKRLPGGLALGLGFLACGLFCAGLRWLF